MERKWFFRKCGNTSIGCCGGRVIKYRNSRFFSPGERGLGGRERGFCRVFQRYPGTFHADRTT
jgi:hypothetical protein